MRVLKVKFRKLFERSSYISTCWSATRVCTSVLMTTWTGGGKMENGKGKGESRGGSGGEEGGVVKKVRGG